ncbi:MAG: pilus assembly protein PilM, partial [Acidobacteriota bacterium]|nr:pilus assembly protein PilM [Acidobacteriota bacterium]
MFKRKNSGQNLVGLDIGSSSVKAVELQGKLGNLSLAGIGQEKLQPDTVVDGQIMELNDVSNVIAGLFQSNGFKTDRVAAGVSGSSVIVKN